MKEKLAIRGARKVVPEKLKVKWPIITQEDKNAVMKVLDRGTVWGAYAPEVMGLQEDFARYIGAKYCIAVNSGTAALHMAVAAAGVGPGDEVITSAFSFLASAVAILHHNAIPIFVDIDPRTYNIDVKKIEEKITKRTRAIIPVHIHGLPCDMDDGEKLIWCVCLGNFTTNGKNSNFSPNYFTCTVGMESFNLALSSYIDTGNAYSSTGNSLIYRGLFYTLSRAISN